MKPTKLAISLAFALTLFLLSCEAKVESTTSGDGVAQDSDKTADGPTSKPVAFDASKPRVVGGVIITDIVVGTGKAAKEGSTITVHATGTLANGKKFWSSKDTNTPFVTPLMRGRLVDGWIAGIPGMREGGTRRLEIPSKLAYGKDGKGPTIPPNSDLIFVIEMITVK